MKNKLTCCPETTGVQTTVNFTRLMSQHLEERNLEKIPLLLLETNEEDNANQGVGGEHLLLNIHGRIGDHGLQNNGGGD